MMSIGRLGVGITCLLLARVAWCGGAPPPKPMDLLLTREELRAIAERYASIAPEDEEPEKLAPVLVRAPSVLAPMRDPSQDVMMGIAAPFWAIAHPRDAWRIFLPIPPRDNPR